MDKAKSAVSDFMSKSGRHDTTVEERAAPAVTQEQIKPTRHEEATTAIDREVHQDHYHTTVQPIGHQEVLPEKHHHQMAGVEHKEFHHGDRDHTERKLAETAAHFKDTSMTHDTKHTSSAAPVVEGERVHHRIHETVQPVIHKETIAPEVVHTTVPIHETHHAGSQHHGTSVLPMKQMSDISSTGGILADGKTRHDQYEGCPKPYNDKMKMETTDDDRDVHAHGITGSHGTRTGAGTGTTTNTTTNTTTSTNAGPHSSNIANKADPRIDSDLDGRGHGTSRAVEGSNLNTSTSHGTHGTHSTTGAGLSQGGSGGLAHGGHDTMGTTTSNTSGTSYKKPSLMDKLNPMKDSDGDGKKGFMK